MDIYKSPSFCLQVCSSSDHISSSTQTTDSSSPSLIQSEITPTIPAWLLCKDMDPPTQVPVMDLDKALGASASYPGQPPFIKKCLPLDHSITIYWARLGASPWIIQQLIRHKSALACAGFTRLPVPGCEAGPIMLCYKVPQDEIHKLASEISLQKPYSWIPTDENIGRYIVSGMTEPAQLGLITSLPEDLFSKIGGLAELFPPGHRARDLTKNEIVKAANERLLENRANLPERVEAEREIQKEYMDNMNKATTAEQQLAAAKETLETLQKRNEGMY